MHWPAVSIVMPVYNMEKYVGEAIESILNQTFPDFELLIIYDHSSDNTLEKIRQYTDKRIRVIENSKREGLAGSENIGLREARGKYVARMDSDDISRPDRIKKLYDFLEAHPETDICGSSMRLFGDQEATTYYPQDHNEIVADLIWACSMPHAACMMRLDKLRAHNILYDESFSLGEDWIFLVRAKDHLRFSNLKEPLYYYRRGPQSMVIQGKKDYWKHNSRVYSTLLADLGISCNENELMLHCFLLGKFDIMLPSPAILKQAREWFSKLISVNQRTLKYNEHFFLKKCEEKWNHLFFKIVPTGHINTIAYFKVSGKVTTAQILYYSKYSINRLIGRHKNV